MCNLCFERATSRVRVSFWTGLSAEYCYCERHAAQVVRYRPSHHVRGAEWICEEV